MEEENRMGLKVCTGFSWMVMANESQREEQNHGGENTGKDTQVLHSCTKTLLIKVTAKKHVT